MHSIPLTKQEIQELLQQAKVSLGQERRKHYGHPTSLVHSRFEQAIGENEHKKRAFYEMYVAWLEAGASRDITDAIDAIINGVEG